MTIRNKTEEALRESEERLKSILDAVNVIALNVDIVHDVVHSTGPVARFFDRSEAFSIKSRGEFFACIHPDDRYNISAAIENMMSGAKPYSTEFRVLLADGSERWAVTKVMVERDSNARPVTMLITILDITDRKLAELELQKLLVLADKGNELIGTFNMNFMPIHINPTGLQLVGFDSLGQALQTPVQQFFFPEDQGFITEQFFPRALHEGNAKMEIRFRHFKTGVALWMIFQVFHIRDSCGTSLGFAIISRDITVRKLTENAQSKSEQQFRLSAAAASAALWEQDLINGRVYFSPEWKRQIGYAPDDFSNSFEELKNRLHPEDRERMLSITSNYLNEKVPNYEIEYRLQHKDGSYRWIFSHGKLLRNSKGYPCRFLCMNLDITNPKSTPELNERHAKMEETFRHQIASQTVAAIAHELNQPLMAVASYNEIALLLLAANKLNKKKLAQVLQKSAEQVQRAGQVTQQLLKILQQGDQVSEQMAINSAVYEAVDIIEVYTNLGDFNIKLDLDPDLPLVRANLLHVEKVLVNLLQNGLDAMREHGMNSGTITITTKIDLDDKKMVQVKVHDTGKGVEQSELRSIFRPFFSTKSKGLGMGLAISRALIQAHGGNLWAKQDKDSGFNVYFTLPLAL